MLVVKSIITELMQKNNLEEAKVGIEPTGHYWFDLGQFMGEKNIKFVMVNPYHDDIDFFVTVMK